MKTIHKKTLKEKLHSSRKNVYSEKCIHLRKWASICIEYLDTHIQIIYIEIHIIHLQVLIETSKQTDNNQTNKETIFTLQGEMNEMKYDTLGTQFLYYTGHVSSCKYSIFLTSTSVISILYYTTLTVSKLRVFYIPNNYFCYKYSILSNSLLLLLLHNQVMSTLSS